MNPRAGLNPAGQLYNNFEGAGEVVAVADNGFDRGHITNTHQAFEGRVLTIYPMSKIPLVNDFNGHGTHVCGLVLGDGVTTQNILPQIFRLTAT